MNDTTLSAQISAARRRLTDALRTGDTTAELRAEITRLEVQLAHQIGQAASDQSRTERVRTDEFRRTVDGLAAERLAAVMDALAPLTSASALPVGPDARLQAEHRSSVAAHLRARHDLGMATAALDVRSAETSDLRQRMDALVQRRAEMADRRRRGDVRPEDGGALALLEMDHSSLATIYDAAARVAGEAGQRVDAARQAFADADRAIDAVEAKMVALVLLRVVEVSDSVAVAAGRVLAEHLERLQVAGSPEVLARLVAAANLLDARLLLTAQHISAVSAQAGVVVRPPWGASPELLRHLRDNAVRRGDL